VPAPSYTYNGEAERPCEKEEAEDTSRVRESQRIQYIFIRTHKLKKLPGPLVSLFAGDVPIIGVNIGGDLARIGRDFNITDTIGRRPKSSIINLGTNARKRDVVQTGAVGMKHLVETVLGFYIFKLECR
jgi:hypothetical protein